MSCCILEEINMSPLTSEFLRKRGSCCGSNCLHCPYGTTLRNIGVVIHPQTDNLQFEVEKLMNELVNKGSVTSSLLDGAFGKTQNYSLSEAHLLSLKDIPCGLIFIKEGLYQKHFLKPEFSDQGIDEAYIRSLL